jgi:hypothetical protein
MATISNFDVIKARAASCSVAAIEIVFNGIALADCGGVRLISLIAVDRV